MTGWVQALVPCFWKCGGLKCWEVRTNRNRQRTNTTNTHTDAHQHIWLNCPPLWKTVFICILVAQCDNYLGWVSFELHATLWAPNKAQFSISPHSPHLSYWSGWCSDAFTRGPTSANANNHTQPPLSHLHSQHLSVGYRPQKINSVSKKRKQVCGLNNPSVIVSYCVSMCSKERRLAHLEAEFIGT